MNLRIKEVLKEKKITAVSLAATLGIAQPSMSNIVNGKVMPSIETLEKIATSLGVEFVDLFEKRGDFVALISMGGNNYRFDSVEALKSFANTLNAE